MEYAGKTMRIRKMKKQMGRWGLGRNYFPQTVAVGNGEEAWGGPGTGVSISCGVTEV